MKIRQLPPLFLSAALLLGGCSSGKEKTKETEAPAPPAGTDVITVENCLVPDADTYVTLGDFSGLEADRDIYVVTDADVEEEISSRLMAMAEYVNSEDPAEYGDLVGMGLTIAVEGESETEVYEEYAVELGGEEFGPEFDEALIGQKTGGSTSVTVSYDEDSIYDQWAGRSVSFAMNNLTVMRAQYPELTDEYARDVIGFDTADDYRTAMKAALEAQRALQADSDAIESLYTDAIDLSEFNGYPEDLYRQCSDQKRTDYESFAEALGMTLDELYNAYQMTDKDVEEEILIDVNRKLLISAICQKEGLTLSEEEYQDYLKSAVKAYDYDNLESLTSSIPSYTLVWLAYEDLAGRWLLEHATINDVIYDYTVDDLGVPSDLDDDGEEVIFGLDEGGFGESHEDDTEWWSEEETDSY